VRRDVRTPQAHARTHTHTQTLTQTQTHTHTHRYTKTQQKPRYTIDTPHKCTTQCESHRTCAHQPANYTYARTHARTQTACGPRNPAQCVGSARSVPASGTGAAAARTLVVRAAGIDCSRRLPGMLGHVPPRAIPSPWDTHAHCGRANRLEGVRADSEAGNESPGDLNEVYDVSITQLLSDPRACIHPAQIRCSRRVFKEGEENFETMWTMKIPQRY
jgi:hypothetical protein